MNPLKYYKHVTKLDYFWPNGHTTTALKPAFLRSSPIVNAVQCKTAQSFAVVEIERFLLCLDFCGYSR
jgi:hypothetical protein